MMTSPTTQKTRRKSAATVWSYGGRSSATLPIFAHAHAQCWCGTDRHSEEEQRKLHLDVGSLLHNNSLEKTLQKLRADRRPDELVSVTLTTNVASTKNRKDAFCALEAVHVEMTMAEEDVHTARMFFVDYTNARLCVLAEERYKIRLLGRVHLVSGNNPLRLSALFSTLSRVRIARRLASFYRCRSRLI